MHAQDENVCLTALAWSSGLHGLSLCALRQASYLSAVIQEAPGTDQPRECSVFLKQYLLRQLDEGSSESEVGNFWGPFLAFVPRLVSKEKEEAHTYVLPWLESLKSNKWSHLHAFLHFEVLLKKLYSFKLQWLYA